MATSTIRPPSDAECDAAIVPVLQAAMLWNGHYARSEVERAIYRAAALRAALPDVADSVDQRGVGQDGKPSLARKGADAHTIGEAAGSNPALTPISASVEAEPLRLSRYFAENPSVPEAEPEPSDDLVRRLRALHAQYGEGSYKDAADAIERLLEGRDLWASAVEARDRTIAELKILVTRIRDERDALNRDPRNPFAVEEIMARAEQAEGSLERMRKALQELVACKDLKDRAATLSTNFTDRETLARIGLAKAKMTEEYDRRKPLAWAAARDALKPATGEQKASVDTSGASSNGQPEAGRA